MDLNPIVMPPPPPPPPPQAPRETMDLLSQAWCSCSAIQVFQPAAGYDNSTTTAFKENPITMLPLPPPPVTDLAANLQVKKDDINGDLNKSVPPPWKADDLKSWIWLQQAIHPELDYDGCFQKRWLSGKITPWKSISIKKWVKEMKQKRKEQERLQRAEVHAAISVAGVAAALAAVAAENAALSQSKTSRENAVASAAALVASQCARAAEAAGAKRDQLDTTMNAAMTTTDATDILTLTAAAATSLRGAATLRGRPGSKERANRSTPTLRLDEFDFDFGKYRTSLAKGTELLVVMPDGKCRIRFVSVVLNRDAKVILKIKKINVLMPLQIAKESTVYDLHATQDEDPIQEADSSYSIVMTTSQGTIKLKTDDSVCYRIWTMSINHMLMLSTTFSNYDLQYYRK